MFPRRVVRKLRVTLGAAAFALLLTPAFASAAVVSKFDSDGHPIDGGVQVNAIADLSSDITVTVAITGANEITVTDTGPVDPTTTDCTDSDPNDNIIVCSGLTNMAAFVIGAPGDDEVTIDGAIKSHVDGGDGADTLNGGSVDDELSGAQGVDELNGNSGSDTLFGGTENDKIFGGADADFPDGGEHDDEIHAGPGSELFIFGGPGNDQIFGGDGDDTFASGPGNDTMDGQEGDDRYSLGGSAIFLEPDGSDTVTDTGTGDVDTASYYYGTGGATVTVNDGLANDGTNGGAEGDEVGAGFEFIEGNHEGPVPDDEIHGSAADETISGRAGDDDLIGGGGVDALFGEAGADNLVANDGVTDRELDCGDGAADIAAIDSSDPAPIACETVTEGDGGGGGGGGTGDGVDTQVFASTPSLIRPRIPNVVGDNVDDARNKMAKVLPGATFDLKYEKKCAAQKNLEVAKQSPGAGKKISNADGAPAEVAMTVCLGNDDFLSDCDVSSLEKDLKPLAGKLDGQLALEVAKKLAGCKVEYDVKLKKKADEEAARLAAEKALAAKTRKKGEINVAIDCPVDPPIQLTVAVGEGFSGKSQALGFRQNGPGSDRWALGASGFKTAPYTNVVRLAVMSPHGQHPAYSAVVDDDEVAPPGDVSKDLYRAKEGGDMIRIPINAAFPGKIRICVFQETDGPYLVTKAIEIDVVPAPDPGSNELWITVGGRYVKFTKDGLYELKQSEIKKLNRPVARSASHIKCFESFGAVVACLKELFGDTSQAVNQASSAKPEETVSLATEKREIPVGLSQVPTLASLVRNPSAPVIKSVPCLIVYEQVQYSATCQAVVAEGKAAVVGISALIGADGASMVAAGAGNVLAAIKSALVAAGGGNMITLAAPLIGADGASLLPKGAPMVAAGGLNNSNGIVLPLDKAALMPDVAGITAKGGINLVDKNGAPIVAAGAGNLIGMDGASIVAAGAGN